jgi:hypothetical protein
MFRGRKVMRVTFRKIPLEVEHSVALSVASEIAQCLQAITTHPDRFVVNDTPWYVAKSARSVGRVVVNNAGFLSKKFQDAIEALGIGEKEKTLIDPLTTVKQAIDGYIEKTYRTEVFSITKNNLLELVRAYWTDFPDVDADTVFMKYYQMYYQRQIFTIDEEPLRYHPFFTSEGIKDVTLRIGVEFETGNIGSSYRALSKLGTLYRDNLIDAAVFTTSVDKPNCAERIWPAANRNGSFTELVNRGYERNVFFPIWELAFAPDEFSQTTGYLKSDGSLYNMVRSRKQPVTISGITYEFFKDASSHLIMKEI